MGCSDALGTGRWPWRCPFGWCGLRNLGDCDGYQNAPCSKDLNGVLDIALHILTRTTRFDCLTLLSPTRTRRDRVFLVSMTPASESDIRRLFLQAVLSRGILSK